MVKNTPYIPKTRSLEPLIDNGHAADTRTPIAPDYDDQHQTDPKVNFNTRISAVLRRRFKVECMMRGISMETAVAEAIAAWLEP